jgi:hypothetical protein
MFNPKSRFVTTTVLCSVFAAGCGDDGGSYLAGGGNGPSSGAIGGSPSGSGGAPPAGTPTGSGGIESLPATCSEAASPFTVSTTPLDPSLGTASTSDGWGAEHFARYSVAIDPATNAALVGFTAADQSSVIASVDGVVASTAGAHNAGIAVTNDGVAALLFDPNSDVDARTWAAVARYGWDGNERFNVDLFRSPNLDDVGTKGAPGTSRFAYLSASDTLVAYFGHTQRYDDGVRHQGGYLATVDASGTQDLLDGWFGSHNLDQRMLVDGSVPAVLGLGDAYPEGIFFSFLDDDPRTNVIYPLAAAGNGAANGQLGGMVDLGNEIVVPFITNNSIPQDLDAGTWPDIDETIADQIRDAAATGTDLGLLHVPYGATPGELSATWVPVEVTEGASLVQLKSARYGSGGLILLAWAEQTGSGWQSSVSGYYTMVIDRDGAICQPKTPLDASFAFTSGDDIVRRPDGAIVWANDVGGAIQIVTLTPG